MDVNNRTDWNDETWTNATVLNPNFNVQTSDPPSTPQGYVGGPQYIDWREKGIISPVQNQGNCGSCTVFASIAGAESLIAQKSNTIYELSEEYAL